MRLEQDPQSRLKTWIHMGSAGLVAVAFFLSLATITQKGLSDARIAWFFGLCFVTVPVLIYQTMVPAWSRAIRFSNVYAFATLDAASALFWFTAWAALAAYVNTGKATPTGDSPKVDASINPNVGKGGCDGFAFGTPTKCKISTANVFFGVAIMFTFIATSYISFQAVMEYKRSGITPGSGGFVKGEFRKSLKGTKRRGTMSSVGGGTLGGLKPTTSFMEPEDFEVRKDVENAIEDDEYEKDEVGNPPPQRPRGIAGYASLGQSG